MKQQFYALKSDLDMVVDDVQNLKKSYGLLDYIAKVIRNSELEQLAQASQMRRIESRLDIVEKRLDVVEKRLDVIEKRLEVIEKTLRLITKHLGIQDAN